MAEEKVRLRFVTRYEQFRVADAPFAVPTKFGRQGLSELINHLLDRSDDDDLQTFDFMVKNRLLRSSLRKFIALHKLSPEAIIEIEYFPALTLNDHSQKAELPSWIGSIQCMRKSDRVVAGCYDGRCHVYKANTLNSTLDFAAHEEPIRCIHAYESMEGDSTSMMLFTGSKDKSIRVWKVSGDDRNTLHIGTLSGHVNSVESMDFWAEKKILLSGDWSGNLFAWKIDEITEANLRQEQNDSVKKNLTSSKGKRSKANDGKPIESADPVVDIAPLFTIRAHGQNVSGLQKNCGDENVSKLYTGSWDHSIKEWDMETQDCVTTLASSKVITSLHYSNSAKLVASSHPDGKLRLWDPRQPTESCCIDSYGDNGNKPWVSQVKWHPSSCHHFASVDYEGVVRLWDNRTHVALGTAEAHEGKGLCLDWHTSSSLQTTSGSGETASGAVISGGSDCFISATPLE